MEGFAPDAGSTLEEDSMRLVNGFVLAIPHGHFYDSGYASGGRPSNGTDWFMNDWPEFKRGFSIEREGGGLFSAHSFDATEWSSSFDTGTTITVTGQLASGGTVSQDFMTDGSVTQFETFDLTGFSAITRLDFIDSGRFDGGGMHFEGALGYDNILLSTVSAVPEPSSVAVIAFVALGLIARRLARHRNVIC